MKYDFEDVINRGAFVLIACGLIFLFGWMIEEALHGRPEGLEAVGSMIGVCLFVWGTGMIWTWIENVLEDRKQKRLDRSRSRQ